MFTPISEKLKTLRGSCCVIVLELISKYICTATYQTYNQLNSKFSQGHLEANLWESNLFSLTPSPTSMAGVWLWAREWEWEWLLGLLSLLTPHTELFSCPSASSETHRPPSVFHERPAGIYPPSSPFWGEYYWRPINQILEIISPFLTHGRMGESILLLAEIGKGGCDWYFEWVWELSYWKLSLTISQYFSDVENNIFKQENFCIILNLWSIRLLIFTAEENNEMALFVYLILLLTN